MGKKGIQKKGQNASNWSQMSVTLREESLGKKQVNVSVKSILKVEHIKNIAKWASFDASMPSLGAFFGHLLADINESSGRQTLGDSYSFTCQRCESILQLGYNCSVRIGNNILKAQRKCKKSKALMYKCHYCSHPNLIWGTPKAHLNELYPRERKAVLKSKTANKNLTMLTISGSPTTLNAKGNAEPEAASERDDMKIDEVAIDMSDVVKVDEKNYGTPLVKAGMTLLEARGKKRSRSKSKKVTDSESKSKMVESEKTISTSNKRRRKCWTSLKEMAESSDCANLQNITSFSIPHFI